MTGEGRNKERAVLSAACRGRGSEDYKVEQEDRSKVRTFNSINILQQDGQHSSQVVQRIS
jgi:hypothetical protein